MSIEFESKFSIKMMFPNGTLVRVKDRPNIYAFSDELRHYAYTLVGPFDFVKHYCYVSSTHNVHGYDPKLIAGWDYVEKACKKEKPTPVVEYTMEDLVAIVGHDFKIKK